MCMQALADATVTVSKHTCLNPRVNADTTVHRVLLSSSEYISHVYSVRSSVHHQFYYFMLRVLLGRITAVSTDLFTLVFDVG